MKRAKQIIAIIGIIILVVMYVMTLVAALIDDPNTMKFLVGSIACTVLVPVMIWAGIMLFGRKKDDDEK